MNTMLIRKECFKVQSRNRFSSQSFMEPSRVGLLTGISQGHSKWHLRGFSVIALLQVIERFPNIERRLAKLSFYHSNIPFEMIKRVLGGKRLLHNDFRMISIKYILTYFVLTCNQSRSTVWRRFTKSARSKLFLACFDEMKFYYKNLMFILKWSFKISLQFSSLFNGKKQKSWEALVWGEEEILMFFLIARRLMIFFSLISHKLSISLDVMVEIWSIENRPTNEKQQWI